MFLSKLKLPADISDYEAHQHLHLQFEREGRGFLFRRVGDAVDMLSIERPKCPSKELPLGDLRPSYPLPFSADLVITATRFQRGMAGQRYDMRDNDQRRAWLRKQLGECADVPFARFHERWIVMQNGIRRLVASCTGTLVIKDASRFAQVLQTGIGRNRAFGCGLIWIPEVME